MQAQSALIGQIPRTNYVKNIKTYRLIGNDLYNVDLQDK